MRERPPAGLFVNANIDRMAAGSGTRAALRRKTAICGVTLAAAFACAPVAVAATQPPTAAQVERRTAAFLAEVDAEPGALAAGTGTLGTDDEPTDDQALFPGNLAVALYGAPQLTATAIGKRSPSGGARKLRKQAGAYARKTDRSVARSINLIGVIATATAGSDRMYRARQDDDVIRSYLKAARSVGARLTLDIQPGRASIKGELRALKQWIELPDVDVGIDPEWNVGKNGVPGQDEGTIGHRELNKASRWLENLVDKQGLPTKAMIVHQFREGSITGRKRIEQRDGAQVVLNFDGIGGHAAKRAGYANLADRDLLDGFSLFYDRDVKLMSPSGVLRLDPEVDYVMYQ